MTHRFKKVINSFQTDTALRNLLPEIKDIAKAWSNIAKQRSDACTEMAKWGESQDSGVTDLVGNFAGNEEKINHITANYVGVYMEYYQSWKEILAERKELKSLMDNLKKARSKVDKLRGKVLDSEKSATKRKASVDATAKAESHLADNQAALTAAEEDEKKLNEQTQSKMLEVERDIHSLLRKSLYKLSQARLTYCKEWALIEEQNLKVIGEFKDVSGMNEDHEWTFKDYPEAPGPNMNPTWFHGDDLKQHYEKKMKELEDQMKELKERLEKALAESTDGAAKEIAALKEAHAKEIKEQQEQAMSTLNTELMRMAADLGMQGVNDAKEGLNADVADYLVTKAQEAEYATSGMVSQPAMNLAVLSRSITGTLFTAMGAAHTLDEGKSAELLAITRETGEAASNFFALLNQRITGSIGGTLTVAQEEVAPLETKLKGLIAFAESVRVQAELPDVIAKGISSAQQAIRDAIEMVVKMQQESKSNDTGRKLEVHQDLFKTGLEMLNHAKDVIDHATSMQEQLRGGEGEELADAEFKIKFRKWVDALSTAVNAIVDSTPLWVEALRQVSHGKGKHEELTVASRSIGACSAQLVACSKASRAPGSSANSVEQSSDRLITSEHGFIVCIREAQNLALASILLDDYNDLTENQAKKLVMATQVEVLRLEQALTTEREKLARLKRLNYQSQ